MANSKLGLLFDTLTIVALVQFQIVVVIGEPQVPCYFIFGDSLVDSGNNNGLVSTAKANYTPYGVDSPQGQTGRFTNGRTVADIIGQLLGFPDFIPSYVTVTNKEINTGVNYGSGSAGIRDESGKNMGDRINFNTQLHRHATMVSQISNMQLQKCIYLVNIGSNDYINNYFMPNIFPTSTIYTPDQYARALIQQYSQQLKSLYKLGARKIAVFGLGFIGCTPTEIARFGTNGEPCVESVNNAAMLFNSRLKPLIDDLNNRFFDARFTLINVSSFSTPNKGSVLSNVPCCQIRSDGLCVLNSVPCPYRALHLYFDGFHPTENPNIAFASRAYIALSPMDAYPYDINHLAQL